jgi:branched-chain amino acid transport system permease protein
MNTAAATPAAAAVGAMPRAAFDWLPLALVPILALGALPLVGSPSTWLTLTIAGLAMGMIVFIIASGLTLVFGLMDVLNFGHGVFIALGAYVATTVLATMGDWTGSASFALNLLALAPTLAAAMALAAAVGWAFERVLVRPVYGMHLKQILITMGGMIIGEELIKVIWGPLQIPLPLPEALRGSFLIGDGAGAAAIERYRVFAVVIGLAVLALMLWTLNRTKVGLLVRAGVQDREMVEALGYRIRRLFVGVFVAGSALAGLGGVLWGLYQQTVTPQMGAQVNILIFIVIIIGGLGSTTGCLVGALLVGLMSNYTGFLAPKVALFSTIGLMLLVLLWRPQGLYPVANR